MKHLDRILRHLQDYGSITQIEAANEYGNYRLSEYIRQLRQLGYNIESQWQNGTNRYSEKTHYVKYVLIDFTYNGID